MQYQCSQCILENLVLKSYFPVMENYMENAQIDQMSRKKLQHVMENCKVTLQNIFHVRVGYGHQPEFAQLSVKVMSQFAMLFEEILV